jgi:hypothetical protein
VHAVQSRHFLDADLVQSNRREGRGGHQNTTSAKSASWSRTNFRFWRKAALGVSRRSVWQCAAQTSPAALRGTDDERVWSRWDGDMGRRQGGPGNEQLKVLPWWVR